MCVCVCVCVCSVLSNSLQPHGLYVAYQDPLSKGFSRQEYWSGSPFPSPIPLYSAACFLIQRPRAQEKLGGQEDWSESGSCFLEGWHAGACLHHLQLFLMPARWLDPHMCTHMTSCEVEYRFIIGSGKGFFYLFSRAFNSFLGINSNFFVY